MIARLAVELHCYIPEELDETWAHLRHLGQRRQQLITAQTASMHRIREFLSVAWPAVLETCAGPLKSVTWLTAVQLVTEQCGGQPARLAAMGWQAFTAAVRAAVPDWGGKRAWRPIAVRVFDALTDTEGVVAWSRRGLLRRVADELADLQRIRAQLRAAEADMAAALDELGLSRLGQIPALSAVGAAAILAETGDLHRHDSSSSVVKHAGMSPSDNASGAFLGDAHITRRGRPGLRLAVWRAVWPMLQFNPVMAAKYQALTQAADAAGQQATATAPQASAAAAAGPGAARPGPRRVRRLPAALALLHGRPRHQLGRRGRRRRDLPARRPQQSGGGCLTSAYVPHPLRVPETFLPDEGESEPVPASGTTPYDTLGSSPPVAWSFSPARLNAVGAGLPGLSMGRPSPLALRRARRPR